MNTPFRLAAVLALPLTLTACATSPAVYDRESRLAMQGLIDETNGDVSHFQQAPTNGAITRTIAPPAVQSRRNISADTVTLAKHKCKNVLTKCKKGTKLVKQAIKKAPPKSESWLPSAIAVRQVVVAWGKGILALARK